MIFSEEQTRAILEMGTPTARIIKNRPCEKWPEYEHQTFWHTYSLYVEQRMFYVVVDEMFSPSTICAKNKYIVRQLDIMKQNYINAYFKKWLSKSEYGDYVNTPDAHLDYGYARILMVMSDLPVHRLFPVLSHEGVPKRAQWLYQLIHSHPRHRWT